MGRRWKEIIQVTEQVHIEEVSREEKPQMVHKYTFSDQCIRERERERESSYGQEHVWISTWRHGVWSKFIDGLEEI